MRCAINSSSFYVSLCKFIMRIKRAICFQSFCVLHHQHAFCFCCSLIWSFFSLIFVYISRQVNNNNIQNEYVTVDNFIFIEWALYTQYKQWYTSHHFFRIITTFELIHLSKCWYESIQSIFSALNYYSKNNLFRLYQHKFCFLHSSSFSSTNRKEDEVNAFYMKSPDIFDKHLKWTSLNFFLYWTRCIDKFKLYV